MGLGVRQIQVQILWTFKLPEPQFPQLQNGDSNMYFEGCQWAMVAPSELFSSFPTPS